MREPIIVVVSSHAEDFGKLVKPPSKRQWFTVGTSSRMANLAISHPADALSCFDDVTEPGRIFVLWHEHEGDAHKTVKTKARELADNVVSFSHYSEDRAWGGGLAGIVAALSKQQSPDPQVWERLVRLLQDDEGKICVAAEDILWRLQQIYWAAESARSIRGQSVPIEIDPGERSQETSAGELLQDGLRGLGHADLASTLETLRSECWLAANRLTNVGGNTSGERDKLLEGIRNLRNVFFGPDANDGGELARHRINEAIGSEWLDGVVEVLLRKRDEPLGS